LMPFLYSGGTPTRLASVFQYWRNMNTAIANYADWDFLFANALLEPDTNRLPERISAAAAAINERFKAIANSTDNGEKAALADALRVLQKLAARRTP
jgi:hypothetical protein